MNCHNSQRYLREAVQSILSQTHKNWELIFWDNQSTDKSQEIIKSFKDKRIKYFLAEKFTSLGEARNQAIKVSKGDFIAFLDCDDLWLPKKLERQLPLFKDIDVGIVISNSIFFNNKNIEKVLYKKNNKPNNGYVFKELIESYFISLETAIIRKSCLDEMDEWFDKRFEVIEEFDLFVRLSKNKKLAYKDEILAKWRVHNESLTWQRKDLFPKETRLFIKKIYEKIPEAKVEYQGSFTKLIQNVLVQEFILDWSKKNYKVNRKELLKIFFKSRKAMLLLILSLFIPHKFFNFLNKKRLLAN